MRALREQLRGMTPPIIGGLIQHTLVSIAKSGRFIDLSCYSAAGCEKIIPFNTGLLKVAETAVIFRA
jgi:hypothetical protein